MPVIPIYVATRHLINPWVDHDHGARWEDVSFDPIPSKDGVSPDGWRRGRSYGEVPRHWIKAPLLSRVIDHPDGRGKVLVLSGEKTSGRAAWVVLARARAGDPAYAFVSPPEAKGTISHLESFPI